MLTVNRRGGFSDRQGIKQQNTEIQLSDFDSRTRIQIFNLMSDLYRNIYHQQYYENDDIQDFIRYVLTDVFCQALDVKRKINDKDFFCDIKEVILNASYDDILTLVEAVVVYWDQYFEYEKKYSYY